MIRFAGVAIAALVTISCAPLPSPKDKTSNVSWRFDNLDRVGNYPVRVEGQPRRIATPAGPAIEFDGVDDALLIPAHPLAGATRFTFEAIFRPEGGAFEQRWFHLAEADPTAAAGTYPPVKPSGPRFLFEIRVVNDNWYLDAFTAGPGYSSTLAAKEKLYQTGRWYHVAQTYDGHIYRSYVDGQLQAESPLTFVPQGPGYASVGTRINRRNFFHGAIYAARFTPRALTPEEFMKIPAGLEPAR